MVSFAFVPARGRRGIMKMMTEIIEKAMRWNRIESKADATYSPVLFTSHSRVAPAGEYRCGRTSRRPLAITMQTFFDFHTFVECKSRFRCCCGLPHMSPKRVLKTILVYIQYILKTNQYSYRMGRPKQPIFAVYIHTVLRIRSIGSALTVLLFLHNANCEDVRARKVRMPFHNSYFSRLRDNYVSHRSFPPRHSHFGHK